MEEATLDDLFANADEEVYEEEPQEPPVRGSLLYFMSKMWDFWNWNIRMVTFVERLPLEYFAGFWHFHIVHAGDYLDPELNLRHFQWYHISVVFRGTSFWTHRRNGPRHGAIGMPLEIR
ncbi:uncharacterized protein LOC108154952 [Drosophila miranda]|uniref:uncharacterized protein LOC108154952 n=1 Tax=Drosophila miranda TaxID=7229 RepID=UPI0007E7C65D|nr:uncharacterized protein LOC108154952 [Drosophila miranda]